jgi:hypothetical protein
MFVEATTVARLSGCAGGRRTLVRGRKISTPPKRLCTAPPRQSGQNTKANPEMLENQGQIQENPENSENTKETSGNRRGSLLPYLLKFFDSTLVDTTALVDQVAGSGRLAGVDVSNDNDVDVSLVLLTHGGGVWSEM